jgi:hypothetical protein
MISFKVTPENGEPYRVTATARDVLTWEKTSKGKSFTALMSDPHLADLYRIAHLASWRQQLFTGSLPDFESTCEIDMEDDEEPDPTQSAPSAEPSSPSPSEPASAPARGRKKANGQS